MLETTFYAFMGTGGFAILTNISWRVLPFASLGGALSWFCYELFFSWEIGKTLCYFFAAIIAGIYSEIAARILKKPTSTFTLCAAIPLAPGALMYRTMVASFDENINRMISYGLEALLVAGAIAAGIAIVTSTVVMIKNAVNILKGKKCVE